MAEKRLAAPMLARPGVGPERTGQLLARSSDEIPRATRRQRAPVCETCNVEMRWSRSALDIAGRSARHVFACPTCGAVNETTSPASASLPQ